MEKDLNPKDMFYVFNSIAQGLCSMERQCTRCVHGHTFHILRLFVFPGGKKKIQNTADTILVLTQPKI